MSDFKIVTVKTVEDIVRFNQAWHSTWIEEGYATATDKIVEKYCKYDPFSVDYLLLNIKNEVAGTMRIVNQNDIVGLPVLNDFSVHRTFHAGEKLCEATLLTVKKTERKRDYLPTFLLLSELWRYVRTHNVSGIVIAADIRLWYLLSQKLNLCFTEIGPQKLYEGSLTVPGYLNVSEQKKRALKTIPRNVFEEALYTI